MSRLAAPRERQRGRSLLELMIAIAVGLLVLGALLIVYMGTSQTGRQSTSVTRMNEDATIALNYIGSSLRMAGFSFPRVNAPANSVSVNGIKIGLPDSNFEGAGIRGCDNGFADVKATFDALACAATPGSPAAFALRFEGDASNTTASGTNPTDCLSEAVTLDTPSTYDPTLNYKLVESRFYVRVGGASGTPELSCAGNGGLVPFGTQPLMQSVEDMIVSYGVADDSVEHGVVNYVTATTIEGLPGTVDDRWGRVINVKLCLLMRSEQRDQAANGGRYMDCAGNPRSSADGLMRRAYSTVFTLRNRAGFATATP